MRKKKSVRALRKIYLGGGMVPIMNVLTQTRAPLKESGMASLKG